MAKRNKLPKGVRLQGKRYGAQVWVSEGCVASLGAFDTPERASLAARLYKFWCSKGYGYDKIPRHNRTVDAI